MYAPFYCEENVWQLCRALAGEAAFAVFVASPSGACPLWAQRAAPSADEPVFWDYHVVAVVRGDAGWEVRDPDTTIGLPVPARTYLDVTFAGWQRWPASYRPRFRVVPAEVYLETFASDRSHMRRPDGTWVQPPPPWPAIGSGSNLARFVDMDAPFVGEVLDLPGMRARFGA